MLKPLVDSTLDYFYKVRHELDLLGLTAFSRDCDVIDEALGFAITRDEHKLCSTSKVHKIFTPQKISSFYDVTLNSNEVDLNLAKAVLNHMTQHGFQLTTAILDRTNPYDRTWQNKCGITDYFRESMIAEPVNPVIEPTNVNNVIQTDNLLLS